MNNLEIVKKLFQSLNDGKTGEDITLFYHPDATQIEYPNQLTKQTVTRSIQEISEASIKGSQLLTKQFFTIVKAYTLKENVIVEAKWEGTLAIPLATYPKGYVIKANFAQFYTFKEDKIFTQINYDCFLNFSI